MLKYLVRSGIVLSGALLTPLTHAAPTDPVAIVNDEIITQQDYDHYAKARAEKIRHKGPVDTQEIIEELIERRLLIQAATEAKIDQSPEFLEQLQQIREDLLMSNVIRNYLDKHPIDDARLKKEYDKRFAKIKPPSEYQVRHILVETEEEAKTIIAKLQEGQAFAELAKTKSIDSGSADNEGELGWITKQKVVPEFAAAVEKLEKGQYTTTPVKTQYGWHVIQLDNVREVPQPSFESLKGRLKPVLQSQQVQNYIENLEKSAKIEILKSTKPVAKKPTEEPVKPASDSTAADPAPTETAAQENEAAQ